MYKKKVLALILAGGVGGRLEILSESKAKPAVPYGGTYRLIDFSLSNCMNSGINNVWVIVQYEPHLLNIHLSGGRPWDLDRTYGGLVILPPYENRFHNKKEGFAEGNADAIYRNIKAIKDFNPDIILVLSSDHIYKLDYRDVIEFHLDKKSDVTMVTTEVALKESVNFGNVKFDKNNKITDFKYKPKTPFSKHVTTEIFVYSADKLIETLEKLTAKSKDSTIKDFGDKLIPYMVEQGNCFSYKHKEYWQDVGRTETYWHSHMDLLNNKAVNLDDEWNIVSQVIPKPPAKISKTAIIDNSLISQGCYIEGKVENSILSPGVRIEKGALVSNSIIHENTIVGQNSQIYYSIIDSEVKIGKKVVIGEICKKKVEKEDITIIGHKVKIEDGKNVKKGGRVKNKSEK